jgi:hypothetical protein
MRTGTGTGMGIWQRAAGSRQRERGTETGTGNQCLKPEQRQIPPIIGQYRSCTPYVFVALNE